MKQTVNYNIQQDSWFSPTEIIDKFENVRAVFKDKIDDPIFKKAKEMFAGAVTLLGAYELSDENLYFMQVNTQTTSPDVMAVKQTKQKKPGHLAELTQLEITEFENHFQSEDVIDFLQATKIPPRADYGEKMLIACMINKKVAINPKEIHDKLREIKPNSTIYLIGRKLTASMGDYTIIGVWPTLIKPVDFNVNTTANKYKLPPRVNFNLGIEEKITYKEVKATPINTYEILGLDRDKIYKKFKIPEK